MSNYLKTNIYHCYINYLVNFEIFYRHIGRIPVVSNSVVNPTHASELTPGSILLINLITLISLRICVLKFIPFLSEISKNIKQFMTNQKWNYSLLNITHI